MKERWDASRLKSTQIDLNTPEMNVYNDLNVARKDEGERARGQAGWPHLVKYGPELLEHSSSVFLFLSIWALLSRKGKKSMGERKRDTKPKIQPIFGTATTIDACSNSDNS